MQREYHPIEVIIGADGSGAIEGVPEGKIGAHRALLFLFGEIPDENTFDTNPLWDWLYFPPGSISKAQAEKLRRLEAIHHEGGWAYKRHESPHVERPGAYTESFFDILKEPWVGRLVAAIVTFALMGAAIFAWVRTREPGFTQANFSELLVAIDTPPVSPTFSDRLSRTFADGHHLSVPFSIGDIAHRSHEAVIFQNGRTAYLVQSAQIGADVASLLQFPNAEFRFDATQGRQNLQIENADLNWNSAKIQDLAIGTKGSGEKDTAIQFQSPESFSVGTRYTFEGGVENTPSGLYLYRLPRNEPPYRVKLTTNDSGLSALLSYVASMNFAITVTGTLQESEAGGTGLPERVIGQTDSDIAIGFAQRVFVRSD